MASDKKYITSIIIAFFALIVIMIISATMGSANIPFAEGFKIIFSKIPLMGNYIDISGIESSSIMIVSKIRLPRIILACLIGGALSICGAVFQGIFKNPMADPYVLGVSSGAALGATAVIVFGFSLSVFGLSVTVVGAFIGAILATMTVYVISMVGGKTPTTTLLLSGITLNLFLSSVISLLMSLNRDQVERIIFWTMGSVSSANYLKILVITVPFIIGFSVFMIYSKDLNLMLMGEDTAQGLGVNVEKTKMILLVVASLLTGASVSVSGIIGFVGIIVPHGVRMLIGPDHRKLLPMSALVGSIFLMICDTIARVIVAPGELPIGVVTALFGAPYFLILLYRKKQSIV